MVHDNLTVIFSIVVRFLQSVLPLVGCSERHLEGLMDVVILPFLGACLACTLKALLFALFFYLLISYLITHACA